MNLTVRRRHRDLRRRSAARGMSGPLSLAEVQELRAFGGFAGAPLMSRRLFLTIEKLLAGEQLAERPEARDPGMRR